jgi:hypothetical protein
LIGRYDNREPLAGKTIKRVAQFPCMALIDGDLNDAGKLTGQLTHPAFKPVAAVLTNGMRKPLNQPGFIGADEGENQ